MTPARATPTPPRPPTHAVAVDGVRLEVQRIDPGLPSREADRLAPLVFLHEGLGSVAMWTQRGHDWPAALCAATGRRGWVYSRRGYGQSDPVPDVRGAHRPLAPGSIWHAGRHRADYLRTEATEVLPRLLQALGLGPVVLVGHSDGATIALLHATQAAAGTTVRACVAMAPHVFVEDLTIASIEQARETYTHTALRERLGRYHRDVDNAFWQWNDVWLSDAFRAFDMRADCRSIAAPLLLVQGLDDEYGTLAQLDAIAAAAPQAQRLELPACGHSPHRDQPEALTAAIREFLAPLD